MFSCPDCAPDEMVQLQLAANARGAIVGLVTLMLLLVLAVVIAGACLKYTRRLLLGGALLLGAGVGTLITGTVVQRVLNSAGVSAIEVTGSLSRRTSWLWQGDFHAFGWVAVLFGLTIVLTESRNVVAITRNRLVPAGIIAGWGVLNVAAGVWMARTFQSLPTYGADVRSWALGLGLVGCASMAFGALVVLRVLSHPKHPKSASVARVGKAVNRHAH